MKHENEQIFTPPPKLGQFRRTLTTVIRELQQYKVWPVCVFMRIQQSCGLTSEAGKLLDVLRPAPGIPHPSRDCKFRFGALKNVHLVPKVQLRINVRMQIELGLPMVRT